MSTENIILTECTKDEPCIHCGHPDWCYTLSNGLHVCKRGDVSSDYYETGASDAEGDPYLASNESREQFIQELKTKPASEDKNRSVYEYTDTDSNPTVQVVVRRTKEGKKVYRNYWLAGTWAYGKNVKKNVSKPVIEATTWYRYQEIKEAISSGHTIYIVEGEGVADSLWDIGLPATTMLGGSTAIKKVKNKLSDLEGASVILSPDWDEPGIKYMLGLGEFLPEANWCLPPNTNWESLPKSGGKDLKDWIIDGGSKQSIQSSMLTREQLNQRLNYLYRTDTAAPTDLGEESSQVDIADFLAERYLNSLAWNTDLQLWYGYEKKKGIWEERTKESVGKICSSTAKSAGMKVSGSVSNGIQFLLKERLAVKDWEPKSNLICLEDVVLNIVTLQEFPHDPEYKFLSQLPYKWKDRHKGCEIIKAFLLEANSGYSDRVELLRAAMNVSVTERGDFYQRFMELVGTGGSGKGTVLNLVSLLCGKPNTKITNLPQLENNRFETSDIFGKKLVLITDSEKYHGDVSVLKALSGGDLIRNERKGVQQLKPFTFKGLVWIAGNTALATNEHTSGFKRRRISLPFDNSKKLSERRDLQKEFKPYLAGLLHWVLTIDDENIRSLLLNTQESVPSLQEAELQILTETNPLAGWIQESLLHKPGAKTYVGCLGKDSKHYLYPSYLQWCNAAGHKSISLSKFSRLVLDILKVQLGFGEVTKVKDRKGSFLTEFVIRPIYDFDSPMPFGENLLKCDDPVTGSATTQSPTSDEFDNCDDFSPIQRYKKNPGVQESQNNIKDSEKPVTTETPITNPVLEGYTGNTDPSPTHHIPITPTYFKEERELGGFKLGERVRFTTQLASDNRVFLIAALLKEQGAVKVYEDRSATGNKSGGAHPIQTVQLHYLKKI